MRILIVTAPGDAADEARLLHLANTLLDRGHQVFLPHGRAERAARAIRVSLAQTGPRAWHVLRMVWSLVRCIRAHRIQVLHVYPPLAGILAPLAARVLRVPVVPLGDGDDREWTVDHLEQVSRTQYVHTRRQEIPVLCYHRLVERDDEAGRFQTHLRVDRFEEQLRYLVSQGYRTLHLSELSPAQVYEAQDRGVVLTFDDGYEDNYRLLFPLLKRYGVKATIFAVSGLTSNEWDTVHGERPLALLTPEQRREMLESGLVEFGAHTVSHRDLSLAASEVIRHEMLTCKRQLERELGVEVESFAYPYGRFTAEAKQIAREVGYRTAVATNSGPLAIHDDLYHVRRIVIFPNISLKRFRRKISGRYVQRETAGAATPPVPAHTTPVLVSRRSAVS